MKRNEFVRGVKDGFPICLGYFSVSFAYGMTAVLSGMPLWAAVMISLTNLTSAGQFAGTNLLLAGGGMGELGLTTLIINMRYFLMSLSVSQKVEEKMPMLQRLAVAFGITDEIFAVSMQHPGSLTTRYMVGLISTPVLGWVGGTLFGGAATSVMPAAVSNALGIALYGMFIAIIIPPAREHFSVLFTVLLATAASVICSYVPILKDLTGGWVIIMITIGVSAISAWLFPIKETEQEETA